MKNTSAQFEVGSGTDAVRVEAPHDLTPEHASRLAVLALAADLEYWARAVATNGYIGLNDLTRTLDIIRDAAAAEA